ncbi:hypothetical protein AMECASPLE_025633 [Ameca splendens]|uniref:Glutathione S-transferase n=1 Tax=Ameca splendens TaxID=208324 RepID=A0ABV0YT24_9TELE
MRDTKASTGNQLNAAINATWASFTPLLSYRPISSMPHCTEAVIHAKAAQRRAERTHCPLHGHTFQQADISVLKMFSFRFYAIFQLFSETGFWVFISSKPLSLK